MDQRVQKTRAQPNKNVESLFSDSPNPFQDTSSWKKAEITPIDFGAGNFSKGTTQQTNEEPDEWDIDYQFKNAKVESNPFKAAESRVQEYQTQQYEPQGHIEGTQAHYAEYEQNYYDQNQYGNQEPQENPYYHEDEPNLKESAGKEYLYDDKKEHAETSTGSNLHHTHNQNEALSPNDNPQSKTETKPPTFQPKTFTPPVHTQGGKPNTFKPPTNPFQNRQVPISQRPTPTATIVDSQKTVQNPFQQKIQTNMGFQKPVDDASFQRSEALAGNKFQESHQETFHQGHTQEEERLLEKKQPKIAVQFNKAFGLQKYQFLGPELHSSDFNKSIQDDVYYQLQNFPGPLKFEKNPKANQDTLGRTMNFINSWLTSVRNNFVLEEILRLMKGAIADQTLDFFDPAHEETLQSVISAIEAYVQQVDIPQFDKEQYFMELQFLEAKTDVTEESTWDEILFQTAFLKNPRFDIDQKNSAFLLHYINENFFKGCPIYVVSMIKMGLFHQILGENFYFTDTNLIYLAIYPCLRARALIRPAALKAFFKELLFRLLEMNDPKQLLNCHLLMLLAGVDLETLSRLSKKSRTASTFQIIEIVSYLYLTYNVEAMKELRSAHFMIIGPAMVRYANLLLDYKEHEKALNYLNLIIENRDYLKGLVENPHFRNANRILKDLALNCLDTIEEHQQWLRERYSRAAQGKVGGGGSGGVNIMNKLETTITKGGKGLFTIFGKAVDKFIGGNEAQEQPQRRVQETQEPQETGYRPNQGFQTTSTPAQNHPKKEPVSSGEPSFYFDKNLGKWVINGKVADAEDESDKAKKEEDSAPLKPPPKKQTSEPAQEHVSKKEEPQESKTQEPPFKPGGSNPFGNPPNVGPPTGGASKTATQQAKQRLTQNRYVIK